MQWRQATEADVELLARWNHQLIRDEGHRNAMTVAELAARMRDWLAGEDRAVIFSVAGEPAAYALYRQGESEIHLRQFYVIPERRRRVVGRRAMEMLRGDIWPSGRRLTVEVLTANVAAVAFWRAVGYRDYSLMLEIMSGGDGAASR